jgi:hypothetical protein
MADFLLMNDGTQEEVNEKVLRIVKELKARE